MATEQNPSENSAKSLETRDLPFQMRLESSCRIGNATFVTGRVAQGHIARKNALELIGNDGAAPVIVAAIRRDGREAREASAGDTVELLLHGQCTDDESATLAASTSMQWAEKFCAEVYLLTSEEGGRTEPLFSGFSPQVVFAAAEHPAFAVVINGDLIEPGDLFNADIELASPTAIAVNSRFAVRENGKTIGLGKVVRLLA